jgi:hypothetical protein
MIPLLEHDLPNSQDTENSRLHLQRHVFDFL